MKSVKIRGEEYSVDVWETKIEAERRVYPLPGYGNNYGTRYTVEYAGGKYARVVKSEYNNGWGRAGHGMTDAWIDWEDYLKAEDFLKLRDEAKRMLEEAEDGTPDVLEVYRFIVSKLEK